MYPILRLYSRRAAAVAVATLALAGAAPASARTLEEIRQTGVIVAATEGQYPPFNFFQGPTLGGFEVELATTLFARMGLRVEWKALGFEALLNGLRQDRWDIVVASYAVTAQRARAVTFTHPYYCGEGVIVTRAAPIRLAADLAGKTVSVQTGTTHFDFIKASMPYVSAVRNFPQDSDARAAVVTGRADAWITNRVIGARALAAHPGDGLRMLPATLFVEQIGAVVAKGNDGLADAWNRQLNTVLADGTYARLAQKWLGTDLRCASAVR